MSQTVIFTHFEGKPFELIYEDNQCVYVDTINPHVGSVNQILVGKIVKVQKSLQAAFVEISEHENGFLPFANCQGMDVNKLRQGDEVLVQIKKEAYRSKDCVLTCNLVLPKLFTMLSVGRKQHGFSKQLSKRATADLRDFIEANYGEDYPYGIVIRSNAALLEKHGNPSISGTLEDLLRAEIDSTTTELDQIIEKSKTRKVHTVLYDESFFFQAFTALDFQKVDRVLIEDPAIYEEIMKFGSVFKEKCVLYQDPKVSLAVLYNIPGKLKEVLSDKVYLKSGAYLYIESTQALTAIDVNSGKNISSKEREVYHLGINLEAIDEIGRQLKLRNLSGIIYIDFINLGKEESIETMLEHCKQVFSKDRVKTIVMGITKLGLVEITRERTDTPLCEKIKERVHV